jgi:hypothetical protein
MDVIYNKKNMGQIILGVLFMVYLVMGYSIPHPVASMIDTTIGKIVVVAMVLSLFVWHHPILGVLGLFVGYHLITQSAVSTGSYGLHNYVPSEQKKLNAMSNYNYFPYTLEQEVIKKMAPTNKSDDYISNNDYSFKPVLDDLHDAAKV